MSREALIVRPPILWVAPSRDRAKLAHDAQVHLNVDVVGAAIGAVAAATTLTVDFNSINHSPVLLEIFKPVGAG
jgi:hypothetical protein